MSKIETDHEFKTRMAAEGRAIYVPGKTPEQIAAEQERKAAPKSITLHLSENDLTNTVQALSRNYDLVHDLGRAMTVLEETGASEDHDVSPIFRLFARAIHEHEGQELESLFKLETKLRDAVQGEGD